MKAWGADVTATCSTDAVEMVQNLGADSVLGYQDPDFKRQLREMKGYEIIDYYVDKCRIHNAIIMSEVNFLM